MHRFIALAAFAFIATPAVSNQRADALLDRAQAEVHALDQDLDMVRNVHLRAQLEERVDRIDRMLQRLENTAAFDDAPGYGNGNGYGYGYGRPSRGLTFQEARTLVGNEAFDSGKLQTIEMIARNGRFTTQQARALADEMTFDSGKAKALIALYPSVIDKQRYAMALDILTFGSSRRQVSNQLGL